MTHLAELREFWDFRLREGLGQCGHVSHSEDFGVSSFHLIKIIHVIQIIWIMHPFDLFSHLHRWRITRGKAVVLPLLRLFSS